MTWKILSGLSGLTMCHNDIFALLIRNQSNSEELPLLIGHASPGVFAPGDEKDKMARAAAVPQIGSLSCAAIGFLSRLFKRIVL